MILHNYWNNKSISLFGYNWAYVAKFGTRVCHGRDIFRVRETPEQIETADKAEEADDIARSNHDH